MPCSSTFFLLTPLLSSNFISNPIKLPTTNILLRNRVDNYNYNIKTTTTTLSTACRASSSSSSLSSSSWISDFDLYELLGVESSSDHAEIKKAYRALQKKCHPDIAGPDGHDMAIILNEVYSLLSDPNSRYAYDQEQAKLSEFRGYTGKPLYSSWFGSEKEQRAVFVDEVRCVGCLKCALHANKTFAIESVYGRARVIAQWADPEDKILDAIETCPVDCISVIERSNLAALEFLMAKQPRGNVRMTGGGNTGGVRVSNIFAEVNKFQCRFEEMRDKTSKKESKEADLQRDSRISAVQGIRSISNWWYWQSPSQTSPETETDMKLTHNPRKTIQPNIDRLKDAAAAAKLKSHRNSSSLSHRNSNDEYWTPTLTLPLSADSLSSSAPALQKVQTEDRQTAGSRSSDDAVTKRKWSVISLRVPLAMAAVSAATVMERGAEMSGQRIEQHVGGSVALEAVNSFEMQVLLAGVTWFVIGMGIVGMFELVGIKMFRKQ